MVLVRNQLNRTGAERPDRAALIRDPIALADDIWIGRIQGDLAKQILDACQPRGLNYPMHRAWGVMYALWRDNPPEEPQSRYAWDPDGRLSLVIRLSRLVHPTSVAYEYTARVVEEADRLVIAPSRITGWGTKAYVLDTESNWLTRAHTAEIRGLLASYQHDALPERVRSALFYYEYAALTYFIDLRWVAITTACESLIHLDGERDPKEPRRYAGSTRVFVSRMSRLTALVLGAPLTDDDLATMYRQRSALAHGQDFAGLTPAKRRLYERQENAVRRILKKAVLDAGFAELFRDDASIRAAFPL